MLVRQVGPTPRAARNGAAGRRRQAQRAHALKAAAVVSRTTRAAALKAYARGDLGWHQQLELANRAVDHTDAMLAP